MLADRDQKLLKVLDALHASQRHLEATGGRELIELNAQTQQAIDDLRTFLTPPSTTGIIDYYKEEARKQSGISRDDPANPDAPPSAPDSGGVLRQSS